VKAYQDNEVESCNVTIGCLIGAENPDSSYFTINDDMFLPNNNGDLVVDGLPYNEYQICCYSYFAECNYWEVCCKTFCFPFIENDECLGFEGLVQGADNSYTSSPRDDNFTYEITPSTSWTVTCTSDFPPSRCTYTFEPGNYRVCYYEIETNRPICCEYICIDPVPPSDECMDIIPYGNSHLLLRNSNIDHTPICWDVYKHFGDVISLDQVAHGENPLIRVDAGFEYEICKKYYGCCDEILECCQTVCFEDPLECDYIIPHFLRLNPQDSLEYEFSLSPEAQSQGLIASNWKIDELDLIFQSHGNIAQTSFDNQDGRKYTISVDLYDPVTECHKVCCKSIFLSSTTAVEELIEEELIVYPNPTSGLIYLKHPFIAEKVEIYSLNGQQLLSFSDGELNTLNIENLVDGIYVLKVKYGEGRIAVHRILKQ
jgi:hypothetical protein